MNSFTFWCDFLRRSSSSMLTLVRVSTCCSSRMSPSARVRMVALSPKASALWPTVRPCRCRLPYSFCCSFFMAEVTSSPTPGPGSEDSWQGQVTEVWWASSFKRNPPNSWSSSAISFSFLAASSLADTWDRGQGSGTRGQAAARG